MYDQGHIYDTCRRIFNVQVHSRFVVLTGTPIWTGLLREVSLFLSTSGALWRVAAPFWTHPYEHLFPMGRPQIYVVARSY